jgi:hypothetical protein
MEYVETRAKGNIQRWGDVTTLDYSIDTDTSLLFHTVRHKLYANKLEAPIREYLTNAADAHQDTGEPLTAIVLHFPTAKDPFFRVRDKGLGIADEDMDIFITYFASTKTTSNLYTGQKGLGCKSAFACSTQFFVTSVFGGVSTRYKASIQSEEDKGFLDTLHTAKSKESTGILIEVPIAKDDIPDFNEAGRKVLSLLDFRPKHNLSDVPKPKAWIKGENWQYLENLPLHDSGSYARMGHVSYPIDADHPDLSDVAPWLQASFLFDLPLGEMHVSPNRESLEYTPLTIHTLRTAISQVLQTTKTDLQVKLDKRKHIFSALRVAASHGDFLKLAKTLLTYRGFPLALPSTRYHTRVCLSDGRVVLDTDPRAPNLRNLSTYLLPQNTVFTAAKHPVLTDTQISRLTDIINKHAATAYLLWLPAEEYQQALLQGIPTLDEVKPITTYKAVDGITDRARSLKKAEPKIIYSTQRNTSHRWGSSQNFQPALKPLLDAPFICLPKAPDPQDTRFVHIRDWMHAKLAEYLPYDVTPQTRYWILRNLQHTVPLFYRLGYRAPDMAPNLQEFLVKIFSRPVKLAPKALLLRPYSDLLSSFSTQQEMDMPENVELKKLIDYFKTTFSPFSLGNYNKAEQQRIIHLIMRGGTYAFQQAQPTVTMTHTTK